MPDRYAPALFLYVLAFWYLLRWLLPAAGLLLLGRLLVAMMVIGTLSALDQHHYLWAGCFAASAALAWGLLRRWLKPRPHPATRRRAVPSWLAWRHVSPPAVATLCERRVGRHVDAAVPAAIQGSPVVRCVLALADDGLWVLEDESRRTRPQVGRVLACWARRGLVAHVDSSRGGNRFELSWPDRGALVRGTMTPGPMADLFAGHLVADEFALRT